MEHAFAPHSAQGSLSKLAVYTGLRSEAVLETHRPQGNPAGERTEGDLAQGTDSPVKRHCAARTKPGFHLQHRPSKLTQTEVVLGRVRTRQTTKQGGKPGRQPRLSEPAHTALQNDPASSQHHGSQHQGRLLTQARNCSAGDVI